MGQEHVEAARRLWTNFAEGAASGRASFAPSEPDLHPDVEYVEDPRWPGSGTYRGLESIQARFAEYVEILGRVEVDLRQVLDLGEQVVLVFRTKGASVQTGLPFEHEWAYVLSFRDGRVVEWRACFDKDEALQAAAPRE